MVLGHIPMTFKDKHKQSVERVRGALAFLMVVTVTLGAAGFSVGGPSVH